MYASAVGPHQRRVMFIAMVVSACLVVLAGAEDVEHETGNAGIRVVVYNGIGNCAHDQKVQSGSKVKMHYAGSIHESSAAGEPGWEFDSSRKRGETFDFVIGTGRVIPGWDIGLLGLCKGAKAKLVLDPEHGYGDIGMGSIPGNATLFFDVEVVDTEEPGPDSHTPEVNIFVELDTNKDNYLTREELDEYFVKMKTEAPEGSDMPSETPQDLWESEDKNKDGKISWDEFDGPKGATKPSHDEL